MVPLASGRLDGRTGVWVTFANGERVSPQEDPAFTGWPTIVYHWKNGVLERSEEATTPGGAFDLLTSGSTTAAARRPRRIQNKV